MVTINLVQFKELQHQEFAVCWRCILDGKIKDKGFIKQESISWDDFVDNKFGSVYT